MNTTRRQFLWFTSAGVVLPLLEGCVCHCEGDKLVLIPQPTEANASTEWLPFSTGKVSRNCRIPHALFAHGNQSDALPWGSSVSILRPADLAILRFELRGVHLRCIDEKWMLFKNKGENAYLIVHFPPQHVAEAADPGTDDTPIANLPLKGVLSGETRLAFQLLEKHETEGIPYTANSLLNWTQLAPSLAPNAIPLPGSEARAQMPDCKMKDIPMRDEGAAPHVSLHATTQRSREAPPEPHPPLDIHTAIEAPYGMYLSPSTESGWLHESVNPVQKGKHGWYQGRAELWHTRMQPINGATAQTDGMPSPQILRAIWSRCGDEGMDLHPSENERLQAVHQSSNFNLQKADGTPYDPIPITGCEMLLTALGGTVRLHGKWVDSPQGTVPNCAEPPANLGLALGDWVQESFLGRDQFVLTSQKGYGICTGHKIALLKISRREIHRTMIDGRESTVAVLRQYYLCQVQGSPTINYPVDLEGSVKGRGNCFRKITIAPLLTPPLEIPKDVINEPPTDQRDTALVHGMWMVPRGSSEPFNFTITAEDSDGIETTFSMPLLWVNETVAHAKAAQDKTDLATIIGRYCDHLKYRTATINSRKIAFVPKSPQVAGGRHDNSLETFKLIFRVEEGPEVTPLKWEHTDDMPCERVADLPAAGASELFDWPASWKRPGDQFPHFYPALHKADVKLDAVADFAPGSADGTISVRWNDAFLGVGFGPSGNPAQLFLDIIEQQDMTFPPDRGGGLANPSMKLAHLSRQVGPVWENKLPKVRRVHVAGAAPDKWVVDAKEIFGALGTAASLLGGVNLADVIAPVLDAVEEAIRVPKLIVEKIREVKDTITNFVKPVQDLIEIFKAGPSALIAAARNELLAIVKEWRDQATEELKQALFELITREFVPLEKFVDVLAKDAKAKLKEIEPALTPEQEDILGKIILAWALRKELADRLRSELNNMESQFQAIRNELMAEIRVQLQAIAEAKLQQLESYLKDRFALVNRSLARIRERAVVRLLRVDGLVVTPEMVAKLRELFDGSALLNEVSNAFNYLDAAFQELQSFPLAQIEEIRASIDTLLKVALKDPLQIIDTLPRELKRLDTLLNQLIDGTDFRPSVRTSTPLGQDPPFVAREKRSLERVRSGINDRMKAQQAPITAAIKSVEAEHEGLKKRVESELGKVRYTIGQDTLLKVINDEFHLTDFWDELDAAAWAVVNRWIGKVNGFFQNASGQMQKALDKIFESEAARKVIDFLGTIRGILDKAVETVDSVLEKIPKEVSLEFAWEPRLQDAPSGKPFFQASREGVPAAFVLKSKVQKSLRPAELTKAPSLVISGALTDFTIHLLPSSEFLAVSFNHLKFDSQNGSTPDIKVKIDKVKFGAALAFVAELAKALSPDSGFFLELLGLKINAGYRFAIPAITAGGFNLTQLAINTSVLIPLDGDKVRVRFAISERHKPFILSVGILGGGGFFAINIAPDGVDLVEGSMEFGAIVVLDIGVASGRAYVMAGIYFSVSRDAASLTGFVRAGGSLNILGLIRMSIEFYLGVGYEKRGEKSYAVGEAWVKVEIDILFFSIEVELRYRKELEGSGGSATKTLEMARNRDRLALTPDENDRRFSDDEWSVYRCNFFSFDSASDPATN